MIYVELPDDRVRRLSFYLAMEEYVARHMDERDFFFMWQVEPSVIFGRNQLIENEVNLEFCRNRGIRTYRRKSGGGCVYADMKNIMFSYITSEENVGFTFNRYINMVVLVLNRLGVDARANGRNDIMIGDRKVSGNAFYKLPGRSVVHGTMLYDTDMENMVGSITPTDGKLLSKGVRSVRQRIALLKDHIGMDMDEFKLFVRDNLCKNRVTLTESDVSAVEHIERGYLSDDFIYGNNPRYTVTRRGRIEGVGEMEVRMELKNDIIKAVNIVGDYFLTGDMDSMLIAPLIGTRLTAEELTAALPRNTEDVVMNLSREELVKLLMSK
ncbi:MULTISPECIES: lipoate protein ligase C-terminal domain-containing protein [Prevotellaceae]|uniref:lipoate--protein ligase n=1 Tax=Prevotellaceae TaxID=171552 RepID=UPI000CEA2CE3|nr:MULTISPECIES: lipoate protein ligase C-terminal domain-containing protein [Prevotellaceae]MCX4294048.1 lipoyltransferase [Prevotella sp.]NPD55467.1 lipoyltransferase [Prevotella sp. PTAC]GAY28324.1 lipoyltransferase [Prevotella sp. MGM1]